MTKTIIPTTRRPALATLAGAVFTAAAPPAGTEMSFAPEPTWLVTGPAYSLALAGPLCEAGDVFTQHDGAFVAFRELPLPQVGDLAVVCDAGAYGTTMSSNYNSRPLISEIDDGRLTAIRLRQSIEQLLNLEVMGEPF